MDEHQKERLARNEDAFRSVNEEIQGAAALHGSDSHEYDFLCECSDAACTEQVRLTLAQYEHVRADPTRFVVTKGHVTTEIEAIVETARDHVLIEKHGRAAEVVIKLDEANE